MQKLIDIIKNDGAESCLLLAPRQIAIKRILKEMAQELGVVMGLKSYTIPGLITSLSKEIKNLPDRISDIVAGEILNDLSRSLPKSSDRSGLLNVLSKRSARASILNTIRDLKIAEITLRELQQSGIENLTTLTELINKFDSFCSANNILEWISWQKEVIRRTRIDGDCLQGIKNIFVTGFNSIPQHYQELIKTISRDRNLYISLPYDHDRKDLFAENSEFIGSEKAALEESAYEPSHCSGSLKLIHGKLFGSDMRPIDTSSGDISFHASPTRFDEIEAVIMRIIQLIHHEGVSPSSIGITMRDVGKYDQYIRTIFDRHSIPFSYRRGTPMLHSPPVRLAMKLTEIGKEELQFDRLLSIVRSKYMPYKEAEDWQELILKSMVFSESPDKWAERIQHLSTWKKADGAPAFSEAQIEKAAKTIKSLVSDCSALKESANPLIDLQKLCHATIGKQLQSMDGNLAEQYRNDFDHFQELLESLIADIDLLGKLSAKTASGNAQLELLRELVSTTPLREYQEPRDAVVVFNFFDMGYQPVDYLFVVGMDENSVPRPPHHSSNLISEADVEKLTASGIANAHHLSTTTKRRTHEEQAFFLATGSAVKQIRLYYPLFAENGKEATPSPYYVELQRLSAISEPIRESGGDQRSLHETPPDIHAIRRQFARHFYRTDLRKRDDNVIALYDQLLNFDQNNKEFVERINTIIEIENKRFQSITGQKPNNIWTGKIEDEDLKNIISVKYGDENRDWSQSALQSFAACPFEFFLNYVLKLNQFEQPKEEGDPRFIGSFYHHILKNFVDSNKAHYPITDFDAAWKLMQDTISSSFQEKFGADNPEELSIPAAVQLRKTEGIMLRFIKHEMKFPERMPMETELMFEGNQCALQVNGRRIGLKGFIDRLDHVADSDPLRYVIIDYKKSASNSYNPTPKKVTEGQSLQLPHYILAIANLKNTSPDNVLGKFLMLADLGKKFELDPGSKKWADLFTETSEHVGAESKSKNVREIFLDIIESISSAEFSIRGPLRENINLVARWFELPPEMAGSED